MLKLNNLSSFVCVSAEETVPDVEFSTNGLFMTTNSDFSIFQSICHPTASVQVLINMCCLSWNDRNYALINEIR